MRARLAADWDWSVGNAPAFELLVEDALYGERASADDWPPRYVAWPVEPRGTSESQTAG